MIVDKKRFAAAVAQGGGTGTGALGLVFREEPDAGGNLGIGEELAGQGDHALDEIRLDQGAADVALAAGIRTHRAIGEQQRHRAIRREVVEHVLDPGEVGIFVPRFTHDLRGAFGFQRSAFAHGSLRRRAVFASVFVEWGMRR